MLNLILAILLGGIFAYFAIQNSTPVAVNVGGSYPLVFPLYVIAFASLLFGVAISGLLNFTTWLSSTIAISSKDNQLRKTQQLTADLKNQVNHLTLENEALRGESRETANEAKLEKDLAVEKAKLEERERQYHPNFWDRLRYRLAI